MSMQEEIKEYVKNTFGDFSAAKIDDFASQINPTAQPKEFLDKVVDFLSTLLGEEQARTAMQKYYDQYAN